MDLIELLLLPFIPNRLFRVHWILFNIFIFSVFIYLIYRFRRKIFNKKIVISFILIVLITFFVYYPLIKDKAFFSYDETDVKYYFSIISTIETDRFNFFATTFSLGYIYLLMNLFVIFGVKDIFATYNLILLFMFVLFVLFNTILYFSLKHKGFNKKDSILIIATIVSNMSFLIAVYRLKVIYFMVFTSIILSYFLLKQIEKKDTLILNLLFISNYVIGGVTRPEYFVYTLVFAYRYIVIKINVIKNKNGGNKTKINELFLVIFVFFITLIATMFYYHSKSYILSGYFLKNISVITDNLFGSYSAIVTPVFFTFFFFLIGIFYKKTRLVSLLFLVLFLYQMNPYSFDIHLINFFSLIIPIIYFYENKNKRTIYHIILIALVFNASVIGFSKEPHQDGRYILKLYDEINGHNANLYVPHSSLFFGFLFKESNVTVYGIEELPYISRPEEDYVIISTDKVETLVKKNYEYFKMKVLRPLSPHDGQTILKIIDK